MKDPHDSKITLARTLILFQEPCLSALAEQTLSYICKTLDLGPAIFCVADDRKLIVKAGVNLPAQLDLVQKTVETGICKEKCPAKDGLVAVDQKPDCCVLGGVKGALKRLGVENRSCVPLILDGALVGALGILSRRPKKFTRRELGFISSEGKRLTLILHHVISHPFLGAEWLELGKNRAKRYDALNPKDIDEMHSRLSHHLEQVTSGSKSDSFGPLPKGISGITLARVYRYVKGAPDLLSRKTLSEALGFSDVTAGTYLDYLAELGVIEGRAMYGKVGRPTFIYSVRAPKSDGASK